MLSLEDVHTAETRTKAYELCDDYLCDNQLVGDGLTEGAVKAVAAYLADSTRNYHAKVLAALADRECALTQPLLDIVRTFLHKDDPELRRMACLALDAGRGDCREALWEELLTLPEDRAEDLRQTLKLSYDF